MSNTAHTEAISGIAGKATIASGAGTAVYGAVNSEMFIALLGVLFTAASFFVNWYYERRRVELQRDKNEQEYDLQRQRLQIEAFDREEKRRIMEDAWSRAEKSRVKQSEAMLAEMRKTGKTFFAPETIIGVPIDMANRENES